jgi:hypothetical protein
MEVEKTWLGSRKKGKKVICNNLVIKGIREIKRTRLRKNERN